METRIRRYFTFRKLNSQLPPTHHTTDELELIGVPYSSTDKGRAPVLSFAPRSKEVARTKDDLDVLAIYTIPYEAAVPGTPPVVGATPIKGNGPVKLQTSRRLSSGELLITTQDHQRTLSDIREGEYIIGRKEPKRTSRTISIKLPAHSKASASTRSSLAPALQMSNTTAEQSPRPRPELKPYRRHVPEPLNLHNGLATLESTHPDNPPRNRHSGNSTAAKAYLLSPSEVPLPLSPGKTLSSRTSLLSRGEEQNATIQALWKAEYARLVAIYGQDGVDRNIAELNRDPLAPFPEKKLSVESRSRGLSATSAGPPPLSPATIIPPLPSPRGSVTQELPFVDTASDYSSVKVPSLLSSEESSSSYTKRTSLFEADVPTTREEVSRIVESMRKNYLHALEKVEEKPKAKRPKKTKQRASYTHTSSAAMSAPARFPKGGRQSWHANTAPSTSAAEKQSKKGSNSKPKTTRDSNIAPLRTVVSKSSMKAKPPLHRADSTTLGSFFGSKREDQYPPSPERTPKASKPCRTGHIDEARPASNDSASSRTSSDNVAPEIDDFDIFYQDLARDSDPRSGNGKPAISTLHVPRTVELPAGRDTAAPPPPNIDWTPRKRTLLPAL
ncbi:hypothetical protein EPUS_06069 [Endocarpon pusillum Z07020]|uniref:Uncharacterized protein n=1 Tax=Endocarpon pusillum (strain Z07020 / HMAS-L-300199) TaxID=1263415 RepID=U1HPV3_ENDPU|nr:uncharacterized protein EPUS_06069 [Endocarpon pusillum Z07020]ERF72440.1 hypothetical protein EPUS_06069 [Endocarpon pusillum Z07020]